MSVKEQLHELIDEMPESRATLLLDNLKDRRMKKRPLLDNPADIVAVYGPWEDDRSTEEIIADLYRTRTPSRPDVKL